MMTIYSILDISSRIPWITYQFYGSWIQDIYAQLHIRWAPPLRPFFQGIAEPQNPTVDPPLLVSPKISGRWMFIPPKWCVYIYIYLFIYLFNLFIYLIIIVYLFLYLFIYLTQSYLIRKCITWWGFLPMDHSVGSFWGWKKNQWISTDHCTGCCCGENPGFWKHKQ
jgi:hypothetical protein